MGLLQIMHPACQDHCRRLFERVMAGESLGSVEATFVARDGRAIEVEGTVAWIGSCGHANLGKGSHSEPAYLFYRFLQGRTGLPDGHGPTRAPQPVPHVHHGMPPMADRSNCRKSSRAQRLDVDARAQQPHPRFYGSAPFPDFSPSRNWINPFRSRSGAKLSSFSSRCTCAESLNNPAARAFSSNCTAVTA